MSKQLPPDKKGKNQNDLEFTANIRDSEQLEVLFNEGNADTAELGDLVDESEVYADLAQSAALEDTERDLQSEQIRLKTEYDENPDNT